MLSAPAMVLGALLAGGGWVSSSRKPPGAPGDLPGKSPGDPRDLPRNTLEVPLAPMYPPRNASAMTRPARISYLSCRIPSP